MLAAPAETVGPARAIDGDTLAVGGLTVRLYGVDAPELGQVCRTAAGAAWDCGAAAKTRLAQLLDAAGLRCEAYGRDRFGRMVARCAAGGRDLGDALVSEGLAWAYRRYGRDYVAAEARAAGRGVWQGAAQAPWDWRRDDRSRAARDRLRDGGSRAARDRCRDASSYAARDRRLDEGWRAASGAAACAIKGNVNARGERIYHMPASPWYDRLEIDLPAGERWFCDEAKARAAGWRPAAEGP